MGNRDAVLHPADYDVGGACIEAYDCECSPAQIVLHAVNVLFSEKRPDLLVSGINYGENLGSNVTLSGTVGGALQASTMGIPALAVSVQTDTEFHRRHADIDWSAAQYFTRLFAAGILRAELPRDVDLLNVNVPENATAETQWRTTRLSRQAYFSGPIRMPTLSSRIGDGQVVVSVDDTRLEADSDIYAMIKDRVVSVTPLSFDLTSRTNIEELGNLLSRKKDGRRGI